MIDMTTDETTNTQTSAILKELSDIKSSLAVNTSETANIKSTIGEIKQDIKEIKNDGVSRREFIEAMKSVREEIPDEKDHEERIRGLESKVWKFIGGLIICQLIILPIVFFLIYRNI